MDDTGVVFFGGDLAASARFAAEAESAGLASAWTTEFYDRSATIALAAMAAATTRIKIGSAIMYSVGRSPLVLAAEARDLDELSGGRLALGLGTGTRRMMSGWHGVDPEAPARRVEELVPLLRRFWRLDEEPIRHEGRFYQVALEPTHDYRPPLRRDIPIYLAGVNPRMVQAAGTVADGLIGHPLFTARYLDEVVEPALERGASAAGRSRSELRIAGYVLCAIHDDAAVARREAKAQIAFYSVVRTYRRILELHGWEQVADEIREAWARGDVDGMVDAIPEEMVDALAVTGPADEARERLAATAGPGYDEVLLYPPSFGPAAERFEENFSATIETFAVHP